VGIVGSLYPTSDRARTARSPDELAELWSEFTRDWEIRPTALAGIGEKSFSTESVSYEPIPRESEEKQEISFVSLVETTAKLDKPVIAAINGDAIGQGLEFALACDIRIASETPCFGLPQIETGHISWDGGTQGLSRLVGRSKPLEMIVTGEVIDAREALRIVYHGCPKV
jgi:enoyl-CoA hydratase